MSVLIHFQFFWFYHAALWFHFRFHAKRLCQAGWDSSRAELLSHHLNQVWRLLLNVHDSQATSSKIRAQLDNSEPEKKRETRETMNLRIISNSAH